MSFPKARGWLTRKNSLIPALSILLVPLFLRPSVSVGAQGTCRETGEIISNNMRILAGNGDTLWFASFGSQGWGVDYTLNHGESWAGSYLGCLESGVAAITFGKGTFLAIENLGNDRTITSVWTWNHATRKSGSVTLKWNDSVMINDSIVTSATQGTYAGNRFYFACQNGGVASWDPQTGAIRAALPGDTVPFNPATSFRAQHPRFGNPSATVFSIDRCQSDSGLRLLALTEKRLWLCDTGLSRWDSSVTTALSDSTLVFRSFVYAFVNNAVHAARPVLYAAIRYSSPGRLDTLSLFRYRFGTGKWTLALKDAPRAIAPAVQGFLYAVIGANQIAGYRDSIADTVFVKPTGLTEALSDADLFRRMTVHRNLEKPDSLQDILFVKTSDTAGNLFIATSGGNYSSDGLYSSYGEVPGKTLADFRLDRHAKDIKNGLGETYALPGILSDNYRLAGTSQTTFIYRLSRDAQVTIKIYDFTMQHVKTIVNNEPRKAMSTGRSTDPAHDVWDGTTTFGKPVAPGLYYFKITASTGERAFGKIIVAKGRSE